MNLFIVLSRGMFALELPTFRQRKQPLAVFWPF
jgi:hypothetical protein